MSKNKEKAVSVIFGLLLVAIFLVVRACAISKDVSENFKEAKSYLKDEGYQVRLYDEEDDINEMLNEMFEIEAERPVEALLAYNEKAEDAFVMVRCADTVATEDLACKMIAFMVLDPYLYDNGYITEVNYTTMYMGHQDLVKHLCVK